jgi:hypothetical protein
MSQALTWLQNQNQVEARLFLFLFHPSFYQRREKFKWSKKKVELGLGFEFKVGPKFGFFSFFAPSKHLLAPIETQMEQKKSQA